MPAMASLESIAGMARSYRSGWFRDCRLPAQPCCRPLTATPESR